MSAQHSFQPGAYARFAEQDTPMSADEYRHYAAQCIRVAQETEEASNKALLLEMARTWRELAHKSEQVSDQSSINGPAETLAPARRLSGH